MTAMFVNLPVTDLGRAKSFYTAIGFTINPKFTDHNAACVVVEEDHSYFMILVREFFQTFTDLPIGDPAVSPTNTKGHASHATAHTKNVDVAGWFRQRT